MTTELDFDALDLATLARFFAAAFDEAVLDDLKRGGFQALRVSDGFVVAHLLRGPQTVGSLTRALGVTQQAISKRLSELDDLGLVERLPTADARLKKVRLSKKGLACVEASRERRVRLERRVRARLGDRSVDGARTVLWDALGVLGRQRGILQRRVRPER